MLSTLSVPTFGALAALLLGAIQTTPVLPKRVVGLDYPRLANIARAEGKVELTAAISSQGDIQDVRVVEGHPLLVAAAREALLKWKYEGCSGSGVRCEVRVSFLFELNGDCDRNACPTELQIDLPNKVFISTARLPPMID